MLLIFVVNKDFNDFVDTTNLPSFPFSKQVQKGQIKGILRLSEKHLNKVLVYITPLKHTDLPLQLQILYVLTEIRRKATYYTTHNALRRMNHAGKARNEVHLLITHHSSLIICFPVIFVVSLSFNPIS
jgi:hypothetical protein